MFKRLSALTALFVLAFSLFGCGADKGQGFVGRWTAEDKTRMFKPSFVMDISEDQGVFHVDLETTKDLMGDGTKDKDTQRFEGKAESDTVLSMVGGLVTMRLEGGVIHFDGMDFIRAK